MYALTFLIVFFSRRTGGGHLLDLLPGVFSGLKVPQLVLLMVDPGRSEASIILRRTGGRCGRHGCKQVITVRLNTKRTSWKASIRLNLTFLSLLLK